MNRMNESLHWISSYEEIAAEYYDPLQHPTCANFSELSEAFLEPRIRQLSLSSKHILEVGCGRSIAARVLAEDKVCDAKLTLLDQSPRMLAHSRQWISPDTKLMVGDARATGLGSTNYHLIVSSLGDPYNVEPFWNEVHRILVPGGICLFTTPAREWAVRLRSKSDISKAEFLRADGATIFVRSEIPTIKKQKAIIERAGLAIKEIQSFTAAQLLKALSPRLLVTNDTLSSIILRGITVRK
jgi:SAM-dependent methyltransferase